MIEDRSRELEKRRIEAIAREFRGKGYQVIISPRTADLPSSLKSFRPDLIAKGEDETVVIEVKTQASLQRASHLEELATAIKGEKGWRFELVVTNPRGSSEAPIESDLASLEELASR